MKRYRIYQVDSFTREPFSGNPAGVVPDARGLTDVQMQRIARELNNSETAFVFPSSSHDYDVEVRYFTPTTEVPLCGHATIAAHYVRAVEGTFTHGRIVAKTGAGLLPVDVAWEDGDFSMTMTQGAPEVSEPLADAIAEHIAEALGLAKGDLRDDCPIAISSAGHSKVMVGLKSIDRLHTLSPNLAALAAISAEIGCNGYYAFTLHPGETHLVHGRMFAPAIGIAEDPVTGNANGPLGLYLVRYNVVEGIPQDGPFDFSIVQGEAIGRAGSMRVHVEVEGGEPALVQITGDATVVFSAEIEV